MPDETTELPPDPLVGCAAKVKRAGAHLESLYSDIGPFIKAEPEPYRFISKVDVETSRYLVRVVIDRDPPIGWSLIVGDFVQNLRAALDHLVWQLVRANGQPPQASSAFPIFDQPPPNRPGHGERERWNRMTQGLHPAATQFIERCQPYHGMDGPGTHVLTGLRRLSNEDKHRTLLPAFAAIQTVPAPFEVDVEWVRDVREPLQGGHLYAGRPLNNYDVVLEVPVEITGPNPEVKLKTEFPLDVGFGWKPVPLQALAQMSETVAGVVAYARRFVGVKPGTQVRRISTEIDHV